MKLNKKVNHIDQGYTSPELTLELQNFIELVVQRGAEQYRDLPWRRTFNPYAIWISEVMLQQTQVRRVNGRWHAFQQLMLWRLLRLLMYWKSGKV